MKNSEKSTFPIPASIHDANDVGLSKREYFAGLAMQGLLSNPNNSISFGEGYTIERAIKHADELLKQLEK